MAAYDIQRHFSGLRVQTARRGRDPFATGFEEDDSEENRKSRSKNRHKPATKPSPLPPKNTAVTSAANPFSQIDALQIDSDDDFLDLPQKKRTDRRPSPAPFVQDARPRRGSLPGINTSKQAAVLAAGQLAYLDDSEDEEALRPRRGGRRPSPAPRAGSRESTEDRSRTPHSDRTGRKDNAVVPKHTVASPFAGTKYLQDSDSEEEAVTSRKNSADSLIEDGPVPTKSNNLEVKRVDKPNKNGSGVSWRAFSASRAEQRYAEVEALQASLRQRGRTIAFCPHATTDDGQRVPVAETSERSGASAVRGRRQGRSKSPPRRASDTKPTEDEVVDGQQPDGNIPSLDGTAEDGTDSVAAIATPARTEQQSPQMASLSLTSGSTTSPINNTTPTSPTNMSSMSDSIESIAAKLTVSPQTIPEYVPVDHSVNSPLVSPGVDAERDTLSRNTSTRSLRLTRSSRVPNSRRSSRRSASANTSASPAHAFLSNWARADAEEAAGEPQPDDEGQAIGLKDEQIIGRTINRGGFGVVKELHSMQEDGSTVIQAVKIVRKSIHGANEAENDKVQQEIEHEISIWRHLSHRHILSLHAVYETDFATFCVMDLNVGGTLFDLVRKARQNAAQNSGRKGLPPHLAKTYAYQLACALRYLHEDMRVCHRDVKLENCLVDLSAPDALTEGGNLRLCDFGLADFLHGENNDEPVPVGRYSEHMSLSTELPLPTASSIIGTLEYASPKGLTVNRKLFETAGDVWAFGVIVYALCTGDLPFRHAMPSKTAELILRADWDEAALRDAAAGGADVIDLVKGCLERDIDLRFTIGDALRSSWFEGCREEAEEEGSESGWN